LPINSQFTQPQGAAMPNPAVLSTVASELFPRGVVAAELRTPGDASLLYPEEAQSVARAVPKRVGEFAAGRLCARRALAEFGITNFPVRMAADRAPIWPDAMVGSITHTRGCCIAVVGERHRFCALGLDLEVSGDVKPELWRHICVPAEMAWLDSLPEGAQAPAATLMFSAKEAFYKCQYPVTSELLQFGDLSITLPDFHPDNHGLGAFLVTPTRSIAVSARPETRFRGMYRIRDGYVAAAVCFPVEEGSISRTEPKSTRSTPARD
jgi:enterobactin synthetase component D / holo-[acyl-carrier protein] synthase